MATKADYIQLENADDVASIRDRLSFLRGQRVLLIWPEEGTILTRKLDLVLIQREAMRRAIRLALVTHDAEVVRHARELNISTFETIGAAERGRWKRGRGKVFTNRFQRPKEEPIPEDLKEVASRIYAEESEREKQWRRVRRLIGAVVFALVAVAIGYVLLPSATVTVTPATRRVETVADITVSPQSLGIDIENRIIPSSPISIQIDDNGTVEATGIQSVEDETAAGSVVFINKTADPVTIPAGTVVTTSAGTPIQFRTTTEANLAGGEGLQIEVPIEALQASAGLAGNVDSGTINTVIGPMADSVDVRNIAATAGGATRTQRVVTDTDMQTVLAIVKQQLQTRAYVEMQSRLTDKQCIILDTIKIGEERDDWKTYSAQVGDVDDSLTLSMKAVVDAVLVDEQFAQQVVLAQLTQQMQAGEIIKPETVTFDLGCESTGRIDPATGQIVFQMGGSAMITAQVDAGQVQQQLAGQSLNDATASLVTNLRLQQGIAPIISLWPEGFDRMPLLPFRISVQVQNTTTP
ncbi:MAG: baseplate J/gp47 family protein [Chloroflexi bacterium]|nr:baseplate J/gp47 family protein [Chloroflexota bacterium]MCC6893542.1 hypothetical protein [Anaerolineae bacterium]